MPRKVPVIITSSLPPAVEGQPYLVQLEATGCTAIWRVTGLPSGLTATSGGLISGIPAITGPFDITVEAACK